mmetsp:Transcript_29396/g.47166  ORF Transcript_29396/g.47166 Transcript_29396/m.47166 type:complete len:406 (-) Transcript_29396:1503-2720(-)
MFNHNLATFFKAKANNIKKIDELIKQTLTMKYYKIKRKNLNSYNDLFNSFILFKKLLIKIFKLRLYFYNKPCSSTKYTPEKCKILEKKYANLIVKKVLLDKVFIKNLIKNFNHNNIHKQQHDIKEIKHMIKLKKSNKIFIINRFKRLYESKNFLDNYFFKALTLSKIFKKSIFLKKKAIKTRNLLELQTGHLIKLKLNLIFSYLAIYKDSITNITLINDEFCQTLLFLVQFLSTSNIIVSFSGKNQKNFTNFEIVSNLNAVSSLMLAYDNINMVKNNSHYIFQYKSYSYNKKKDEINVYKKIQKRLSDKKNAIEEIIKSIKKNKKNKSKILVIISKSIFIQENEEIISHCLKKFDLQIAKFDFNFGRPGFTRYKNRIYPNSLKYCKRFYSHIHRISDIFMCKLLI